MPENEFALGFDIKRINAFIITHSEVIYVFYMRLINIDLSEMKIPKYNL